MKTKFKSISLIATSALLMAVPVVSLSCSNPLDHSSANTFDVGTDASFAPYNFAISANQYNKILEESKLEQDNLATPNITPEEAREFLTAIVPADFGGGYAGGYDMLVANHVAEDLHEKAVAHIIPFQQLIPTMRMTNQLDAIAADMSDTPERRIDVNFTFPYNKPKNVILYNKSNVSDFALDPVTNLPIATKSSTKLASMSDTTWFDIAEKIPHNGQVVDMTTTALLEDAMINQAPTDPIDGILYEEARAKLIVERHPDTIGIFGSDELIYQTQPDDLIAMALPKNQYYSTPEGVARMRTINASILEMQLEDWEENMDISIRLAKYVGAA